MDNLYIFLCGMSGILLLTGSCYASYRKEKIIMEHYENKKKGLSEKVDI